MKLPDLNKKGKIILLVFSVVFIITVLLIVHKPAEKSGHTEIIAVSTNYPVNNRNEFGSMTFKKIVTDKNFQLLAVKTLRTTNINNQEISDNKILTNFIRTSNLIKGHTPDEYYFYSYGFNPDILNEGFYTIKIMYRKNENKLLTSDRFMTTGALNSFPTDVDYRGENILFNTGNIINMNRPRLLSDYTQKIPETEKVLRKWLIRVPSDKAINALFKDEDTVVLLTRQIYKNHFVVISSSEEKKCKTIEQFEPKLRFNLFPIFSPMDLSPDRSTLAFFTILLPEDNSENTRLLLVCYDLEKEKMVNEIALYIIDDYSKKEYHPTDLKWNPVNKDLILFFHKDKFYLIDIPQQKTEIIDTTKIQCQEVKSFRWSPDGKQIGILDFSGKLFIYDIALKKTEKIYHDPDCFDFFWVE